MATYTQEQLAHEVGLHVAAAFGEIEKRLLPARLSNTCKNALAIATHLVDNQMAPTAENVYSVISTLAFELAWEVEPEKVRAMKANERPIKLESPFKVQEAWEQKVKAGEVKEQQRVMDEASIKQATELIAGYLPTKSTSMGERIDYADQTAMQQHWAKALKQAIATKSNLQEFTKALAAAIQNRYQQRERRVERM